MRMTGAHDASEPGNPFVAPIARIIIKALENLPAKDRSYAIEMVTSAIRNLADNKGAKSYIFEINGKEATIEAGYLDGLPVLKGRITYDDGTTFVSETLISMSEIPETIYEAYKDKSSEGKLKVKDIVSFAHDDDRIISAAHGDPDRNKIWFQIEYDPEPRIRTWPKWQTLTKDEQ